MSQLLRVRQLDPDAFVAEHLLPRRPVIITGEVPQWPAFQRWTWDYLNDQLGDQLVEIYDDWFVPCASATLRDFLAANIGRPGTWRRRYVRLFSRSSPADGYWADEAFAALRNDWHAPALLPATGYIVPPVVRPTVLNPVIDLLPYRALFISGAGARTRLHVDPWMSSALLCGVVGNKRLTMWPPDCHDSLLTVSRKGMSGQQSGVPPTFEDTLCAGEMVFIPAGWWHEVDTVTDAVSVTWNFVHRSHADLLRDYVARFPDDPELAVMTYFLAGSVPGAGPQELVAASIAAQPPE